MHSVCVRACACVWPIWQVMDCNSDGFQCLLGCTAYCDTPPTGGGVHDIDCWQGANVECRCAGGMEWPTVERRHKVMMRVGVEEV